MNRQLQFSCKLVKAGHILNSSLFHIVVTKEFVMLFFSESGRLCSFYCFHEYHHFLYSWSNARVLILWAVMDAVKKKKKTNHKEHECLHGTVWQTVFCLHQEPQPVNLTMVREEVRAKQEPLPMICVLYFFLVRPVWVEWFFRMTDWFCLC